MNGEVDGGGRGETVLILNPAGKNWGKTKPITPTTVSMANNDLGCKVNNGLKELV